jgi:hypothetical protein
MSSKRSWMCSTTTTQENDENRGPQYEITCINTMHSTIPALNNQQITRERGGLKLDGVILFKI